MAAGLVTLNILDGDGVTRTARFMSSDGTTTGTLKPVSVTLNSDETVPVIDLGSLTETPPATDTTSSGVNGRLQRIAQRISSLIALVPTALGRTAATAGFSVTISTEDKAALDLVATDLGATNETAPASDTAVSGLNGRAQRIAQRLSSLITALGSPFQAGGALGAGSAIIGKVSAVDSGGTDATNTTAHTIKTTLYDTTGTPIDFTAESPVNQTKINGVAVSTGNGVVGTGVQRVALASDTTMPALAAGSATVGKVLIGNVDGREYETVAASQTAQALGATGATGDDIDGILVIPATAGCGVVTLLDNATSIPLFVGGGTTALSNLIPFYIPLGMRSVSGAWKISTGANVSCIAIGNFT